MDDFMHYGVAAGMQAVVDSGIDFSKSTPTAAEPSWRRIGGLGTIEGNTGAYCRPASAQDLAVLRAGDDVN